VNEEPNAGPPAGSAYTFRPATAADIELLTDMTLEAFNWDPERPAVTMAQLRADPALRRYVVDWPASGEQGTVAETPVGEAVGAVWWRFFPADQPGYGFVAEDVPELSLAVAPGWRGRGVGRALLRALFEQARAAGLTRVSLSVERANHAADLYASEGFEVVDGDENADTMVKDLADRSGRHR